MNFPRSHRSSKKQVRSCLVFLQTPSLVTKSLLKKRELRFHFSLKKKARIFGVSIDPVKSHEKFIRKHELPFPLIADEDKKIAEAYGVWVEKSMYGKKYMGIERSTFVIDERGVFVKIYRKVKPEGHAVCVLEDVKG